MHSQAPHSNCATACALESVSVVAAGVRAETAPRLSAYNYQMAGSVSRQECCSLAGIAKLQPRAELMLQLLVNELAARGH